MARVDQKAFGNRVSQRRAEIGISAAELASRIGMKQQGIASIEAGDVARPRHLFELARELRTSQEWLLYGSETGATAPREVPKFVPIMGDAAAGGDTVVFYDDAQGPFDEIEAPEWATKDTVAVRIRGTSMGRFLDGWVAFYDDRRDPPDDSMVGRVCICGLTDGRVVVKKMRPAAAKGHYHLESETEPTMFDVPVTWAARVRELRQM